MSSKMYKIIIIIITSIIFTLLLFYIPNKSNISKKYIIPIIVSLLLKYLLGDLDSGYQYTISDIYYWLILLLIPYLLISYLEK